jgi:excisionase family DNA binding protein
MSSPVIVTDAETLRALIAEEVRRALEEAGQPSERSEWLDAHGAAEFLGVTTRTIRNMVRRGDLPEHRSGRLLRFRRADLEAHLRRGG